MITLAEAKTHLRVDTRLEDAYIISLIIAAYNFAENYTNRVIVQQTETLLLDDFAASIILPELPVISLTSVNYLDADSVSQAFTDYYLDNRGLYAVLQAQKDFEFPTTDQSFENVSIVYEAGYTTIPQSINHAVLLIIGSMYDQRENHVIGAPISKVPLSAEYLLNAYRVVSI